MFGKLMCSYFKVGKKRVDDERLYEIEITEPCGNTATRVYNGTSVCEEHYRQKVEADKEAYRKSIEDIREIRRFKMEKLRSDISSEYVKKKTVSWKEATLNVLITYLDRYGAFWVEPCVKELVHEAKEKDNRGGRPG